MSRHRESGYGVREVVLQVRTGTHLLAGTEAKVWMRVGNENDRTQWFHVASESGAFRRGEVDEVVLRLGPSVDPGVIDRVEVFHDGGGAFDGWYLDEIHVEGRRLDFDTWLARDEPPYRLDATSLYDEQLRAYTVDPYLGGAVRRHRRQRLRPNHGQPHVDAVDSPAPHERFAF